jgi:hypothetical protein
MLGRTRSARRRKLGGCPSAIPRSLGFLWLRCIRATRVSYSPRRLSLPERQGHQRIGEDEPRLRHLGNRQQDLPGICRIIRPQSRVGVRGSQQDAPEAPPPADRRCHLHLDQMADVALEIGPPHQRAIDAGG